MPESVNVYDAKTNLSRLVARAESGEEIVISRNGRPVARLAPLASSTADRVPGAFSGRIRIAADFDGFTTADDRDWYGE